MHAKEMTEEKQTKIKLQSLKTGSGPEERSTVSSFRPHQNTTAMHTNGICIT